MNNKKNNINNKNIIQIDKSEFDFISKLMPVAEILEQKGILKSNSEFLSWIETPISELSNQKPSDLVRRGKLSEVLNYVNGLK